MNTSWKRVALAIVSIMATQSLDWPQAWAVERAEIEETALLLANLLTVGRLVIEQNQPLIDDPHRGDKGFTPEVFEQQLIERFKKQTDVDLARLKSTPPSVKVPPLAHELLPMLVAASKDVVREAQIIINQKGIGYKNFIPATFGSQAAARFAKVSHVKLKQTTLNPRNPKNNPDEYEASILRWLASQPPGDTYVREVTDEGKNLRVVVPLYYDKECLTCHGEPKGILDISGYPREGHKVGDLAGAITVIAPLTSQ
jgi:Protein of unknown function (DUF3365)